MITILISTEEYDLVSLRFTVRRRVKRFGGKPVKVMGRGGGGRGELVFLQARPTHQRDRG